MPAPRRPWQPREDESARRARIASVSRGASVAALVLMLATAGSVVGIVTSNRQHGIARAAAVNVSSTADSSGSTSSTGSSPGSNADPGHAATSATVPSTVLPVVTTTKPMSQGQPGVIPVPMAPVAVAGPIPLLAWQAYHRAAASSGCHLPWYLLAGIGKIESDHGRFHGARFDVTGAVRPAIYGPPTAYGRAMGPMQFIPPTWASYATDGNGDGKADPQNIFDATKAAAHYLCNAGGADLSGAAAQRRAVFAYNHLDSYVADVLAFAAAYQHGRPESSVPLVPIVNPKPAPSTTSAPRTPATTSANTTSPSPTSPTHSGTTSTPTTSATSPSGSPTPTGSGGICTSAPSPSGTPTSSGSITTTGPTKTTAPTKTTSPAPSTRPNPTGSAPTCPVCPTPSGSATSAPSSTTAASSTTSTSSTCVPSPTRSATTRPAATRTS